MLLVEPCRVVSCHVKVFIGQWVWKDIRTYHDAHVLAEKPECTCGDAGNEQVELDTRRTHVGSVSRKRQNSHFCENMKGEVVLGVALRERLMFDSRNSSQQRSSSSVNDTPDFNLGLR